MFKKLLLTLLFVATAKANCMADQSEEAESKSRKCKTFQNLNVCKNLNVGGTVTANNFMTSSGQLFGGIRNYAVLTNQAEVISGDNILWAETPTSNLSSGISFNATTGSITLPTSGLFLVQYTVRFTRTPYDGTSIATAQLQQTVAGTPTNITQPAITTYLGIDGTTGDIPQSNALATGYALVSVTSSTNNTLNLVATFDDNATLPATTGTDANAQIVILQLN